jgi:hypothetical protein
VWDALTRHPYPTRNSFSLIHQLHPPLRPQRQPLLKVGSPSPMHGSETHSLCCRFSKPSSKFRQDVPIHEELLRLYLLPGPWSSLLWHLGRWQKDTQLSQRAPRTVHRSARPLPVMLFLTQTVFLSKHTLHHYHSYQQGGAYLTVDIGHGPFQVLRGVRE